MPSDNVSPFLAIYSDILNNGIEESPRGCKILELENYSFRLHPINDRFTSFKARKMNLDYAKFEIAWYLRGNRFETESVCDKAQMWKTIIDVDGGINSNYGQYIFKDQEQLVWVINELQRDKSSRRAVMTLLNCTHLRDNNPDVVCTYAIGFRIRRGKLNMTVHMRSCDAIWGMTNDVFCFSVIYEIAYCLLQKTYPDLEIGEYYHIADSLHVYERHFNMLQELVSQGQSGHEIVECPRIHGHNEAIRLWDQSEPLESDSFSHWLKS